ncbi:hypothetical protein COU15_00875 [Candidatus Kaiserbacteria bacterium CG10_big_fil_rev_8_21_14_0_10_45_20]|uniref:HD/PDEase domain-containing protein n=1 Tax=Candidatus Kaiserbacteria bacterium CG10_big_fil_rev_8_21_14_0_10_45_20 TaxID=1974607 RepID=A0A2H0UG11_9BACT|nr:MAG: hypothetical protein COU15_00875 [Candidatus Kaiserbacteria bacterium CG10_big_fil_rev_8_21_14_0_10_45_20]
MNKPEIFLGNRHSPEKLYSDFFEKIKDIKSLNKKDKIRISHAYKSSERAHKGQFRAGGEAYFEHPRAVALILMEECGVEDFDLIVAALLHDILEDTSFYADLKTQTFYDWKENAKLTISDAFRRTVAKMVLTLSKPFTAGEKETKEQQLKLYYTGLNDAIRERPKTILVKMADRLHNLRTIGAMPEEKRIRKLQETRDIYIPLFEKFLTVVTANKLQLESNIEDVKREIEVISKQIEEGGNISEHKEAISEIKKTFNALSQKKRENEQNISAGTYLLTEIKKIVS